jgi:hypothetical protein
MSSPESLGGGEHFLLTQPILLTLLLPALLPPDSPLLPTRRPLLFPSLRARVAARACGVGGSDRVASIVTLC